jgi:hypothetical protein
MSDLIARLRLAAKEWDECGSVFQASDDEAKLLREAADALSARPEVGTRVEEAAFNLCQLTATSNRMLSRDHLISCAEKRLRELDPNHSLLSPLRRSEPCPYQNDDGHVAHRCPHCSVREPQSSQE